MKMKQTIASLMAIVLAVCSNLTAFAATGAWAPKPQDVFRDSGLIIYDKTTTAVATATEIIALSEAASFTITPQFFSAGGKKLGEMKETARAKLEKQYQANNSDPNGFALWLVNMFNDYRGVKRTTQKAMDSYWAGVAAKEAQRLAEYEKLPMPDLSKATYQEVFAGATITVSNKKAQAVRIGAYDWPMTRMYFIGADGSNLGYMSADAYMAMIKRCGAKYGKALDRMPGGSEGWYAQMFNDYRGVKRLTLDEYLSVNRIKLSALSAEELKILEQVYGKSADSSKSSKPSSSSERAAKDDSSSASKSSSNDRSETAADASGWPSEVVRLTNQERAKEGLAELAEDSQLMELAAIRAKELAQQFSHTRPNGKSASAWVMSETGASTAGENIASGYTSPQRVITGWMNSSGHKANILKERYTAMGVGHYRDPNTNKNYWVQLFAASPSSSRSTSGSGTAANGAASNDTAYSLNKTELKLTAGEGFQLSVNSSGSAQDIKVEWEGSKIGQDILSVDDNGYVTTFYREGLTSATATLNVSAKVYVSGKLVKTLRCKITVTQ